MMIVIKIVINTMMMMMKFLCLSNLDEDLGEDDDCEYDFMAESTETHDTVEEKEEYRNDRAVRIPSMYSVALWEDYVIHSFFHYSSIHSFIHQCVHSFVCSFIPSHLFHSFIHPFTLISFIHSFIHPNLLCIHCWPMAFTF